MFVFLLKLENGFGIKLLLGAPHRQCFFEDNSNLSLQEPRNSFIISLFTKLRKNRNNSKKGIFHSIVGESMDLRAVIIRPIYLNTNV